MPAVCRRDRGCAHRPVAVVDAGAPRLPAASARSATSSTSPTMSCSSSGSRCMRSIWRELAGPAIVVRRARAGEPLTTLDGKKRVLDTDMLVIADADRASAVAGVMGGADSEVSAATQQIVFESAWFKPQSVRATSKRLGLRDRSVVPLRARQRSDAAASKRWNARWLFSKRLVPAAGAAASSIAIRLRTRRGTFMSPQPASSGCWACGCRTTTRSGYCKASASAYARLGGWQTEVPDARASVGGTGGSWQVEVPGWRVDIARDVDVIEEAGRHHGFEHLPTTFPAVEAAAAPFRSADRPRWPGPARLARYGPQRSHHVRLHRHGRRRRVPRRRRTAGVAGQSALGEVHHAPAESLAWTRRRSQPQSPARPARCSSLRNRHSILAARRIARRRRGVDGVGHSRSLERWTP